MNEPEKKKQNSMKAPSLGTVPKKSSRTILDYWNSFDSSLRRTGRSSSLQSRKTAGPMARLWSAMRNAERVLVITRGLREPRATLTGTLIAFDRYWNLILSHVTECSVKLDQSTLAGHGRPGRSKRRRQQRLTNLLRRYGHLLNPTIPGHVSTIRDLYQTHRCRRGEPLEIGQLIPTIGAMDEEMNDQLSDVSCPRIFRSCDSINQTSIPNCHDQIARSEVHSPPLRPSTSSVVLLGSTSNAKPIRNGEQSPAIKQEGQARHLSTQVSHHSQLFIRGANIVYVSFCKNHPT